MPTEDEKLLLKQLKEINDAMGETRGGYRLVGRENLNYNLSESIANLSTQLTAHINHIEHLKDPAFETFFTTNLSLFQQNYERVKEDVLKHKGSSLDPAIEETFYKLDQITLKLGFSTENRQSPLIKREEEEQQLPKKEQSKKAENEDSPQSRLEARYQLMEKHLKGHYDSRGRSSGDKKDALVKLDVAMIELKTAIQTGNVFEISASIRKLEINITNAKKIAEDHHNPKVTNVSSVFKKLGTFFPAREPTSKAEDAMDQLRRDIILMKETLSELQKPTMKP